MKINARLTESSVSSEEFTQRLSGLESKLQRAMAEKDALLDLNKKLQAASAGQRSANELNELITEKDEIIEDLRREGEKLSKQASLGL